ncbi:MAG TPA: cysteine desulfurase-like protein [Gaiellaceae bacterium]|nr:cysteine desulfurase-like protein [Gaiellaceae bacterium]
MTTAALDVERVRARFSALDDTTALFDAPGGTQVPDTVIAAIADYLRESNANLGGAFGSSRRSDALVAQARLAAASFLRCEPDETVFGANMTTLNFALTRTVGRTLRPGDEILATVLDHDANVAPWLELARDLDLRVQLVGVADDTTLDYDDLERKLTDRTRIVAFPLASNAVGTLTDVQRIAKLAHDAGALTWVDAVHYAPHGPIDVRDLDADVLICSPYKFFGPHLGLAAVRAELAEAWRTYKVRPSLHPFETGTLPHELLAGFVKAVEYVESVGWDAIRVHERSLGERFLDGVPDAVALLGLPSMDNRVPTFAFRVDGLSPQVAAQRLADRGLACWDGDYFAVEIMRRLGRADEGAVRVGFVHYNTHEEVDRLLAALAEL